MLYNIIASIKGCQFANIVTLTEVAIPKKWGIVGKVTKHSEMEVQINYSYENAVNNRLEKQGNDRTFVAKGLTYGEWEIPNKIIKTKDGYQLRYYALNGTHPKVEYKIDGRTPTAEELAIIKEYNASKNKSSARQSAEGLTANQVVARNVKFENILSLKVNGQVYIKPIPSTLPMVG